MPNIAFNDKTIAAINVNKTTWFTNSLKGAVPGLRLMAGARSKTWYMNKRDGGKVRQVRIGAFPELTVEIARRHGRDLINAVEAGTMQERIDNDTRTFSEALDGYIERNTAAGSLSEGSAEDYRRLIRVHASDWSDQPLNRITTRDVERRFLEMDGHAGVCNKLIRVVRQVYKYAMAHDDALLDPTRVIQRLRPEPRRQPLTHDLALAMGDVLEITNPVKRAAWFLLLHTGLRSGSLRTMTWDDVDFRARTIARGAGDQKNKEARTFPISNAALAVFKKLKKGKYDAHLCFPSFRRYGPLDQLDAMPHARQHDMRHHFTTAGALCNVPEYALAFLRGDKVTTVNQSVATYLHNIVEHSTVNRISKRLISKSKVKVGDIFEGV